MLAIEGMEERAEKQATSTITKGKPMDHTDIISKLWDTGRVHDVVESKQYRYPGRITWR